MSSCRIPSVLRARGVRPSERVAEKRQARGSIALTSFAMIATRSRRPHFQAVQSLFGSLVRMRMRIYDLVALRGASVCAGFGAKFDRAWSKG
jgi:hypothetical protein